MERNTTQGRSENNRQVSQISTELLIRDKLIELYSFSTTDYI